MRLRGSARRDVVERMRAALLEGRYSPGQRLIEATLARELGVSRIPVREALRVLAGEGLVEVRARRGAVMAALSHRVACETIEVRAAAVPGSARLAATRRDPQLIEAMQALVHAGRAAADAGDPTTLMQHNARYHELMGSAGSNDVLYGMMRTLRQRTLRAFVDADPHGAFRAWREHEEILREVIAGDHQMAGLLAVRHVHRAGERFLCDTECGACARGFRRGMAPAWCPTGAGAHAGTNPLQSRPRPRGALQPAP